MGGNPPVTAPTTATPWLCAFVIAETAMDRMTAMIAPGMRGRNRLKPRMIARVPAAKPNVHQLMLPSSVIHAHCCWNQFPDPFGTPSMSGICPDSTWTPTPVRKPISTDELRKSPMKPSLKTRASSSMPPHMSAMSPQ